MSARLSAADRAHDDDYLGKKELEKITGYERPSYQAGWLRDHNWVFADSKKGPQVLRAYRDFKLGVAPEPETKWQPNFSAVG